MKDNQDDDNEIIKAKTFELSNFQTNDKQEENILNETLNDTIMDGEYSISNINRKDYNIKHKYFYEFFISFFLFINSFISYSFTNILHICYSFYIIYTAYTTYYTFRISMKKYFGIVIIIFDSIYLFFKAAIHFYINAKKDNPKNKEKSNQEIIFVIFYNWRTIYDYIVTILIIIMLLINIIIKNFNHEYFNNNQLIQNVRIIEKYLKNRDEILNLGIILLCLGSSICPSSINLIFLFIGLIFFYTQLLNKNFKTFMKKYLKYFFLTTIVLYTIYDYIFSSFLIETKILELIKKDKIPYYFGITKIFDNDNSQNNKNQYNNNALSIFHFLFFYISFYFINLHTKFIDYIYNTQENRISYNTSYMNDKDINSLIPFKENEEPAIDEGEMLNTRTISLTGSFIVNKEKTKMQALFDSDMDCAIIFFLKETKSFNLLKKIKLFLSKFCYTPGFTLHACRIGFIYWINFFNIYYDSYFIIVWLLFSIKYSTKKYFLIFTKYIIYPFLMFIFVLSYYVNIFWDKKIFNIEPEKTKFKKCIYMFTKIVIVFLFQMYIQLNDQHLKNLKDLDIKDEIKKQQKDIEKRIEQDFKGIYVVKPLEVFFKLYFILIDIFVVIFFYLSVSTKINLFNQIVLINIIVFLIASKNFKKHLYICLCILTISFLLKYSIYIIKLDDKNVFKLFSEILFYDDLEKIHYYWISYYLLFLEYI